MTDTECPLDFLPDLDSEWLRMCVGEDKLSDFLRDIPGYKKYRIDKWKSRPRTAEEKKAERNRNRNRRVKSSEDDMFMELLLELMNYVTMSDNELAESLEHFRLNVVPRSHTSKHHSPMKHITDTISCCYYS